MFENTLALVEQADLSYLHVFPFSPRSGTPAAKMPQLARTVIKERARRLREMGSMMLARRLDGLVGTRQELLVEEPYSARTRCFAPVILAAPAEPGSLLYARVESSDGRFLHARVLQSAQPLVPQAVA
jgi:threonylcarbamoyladenosine tRNA methylthiotransferase MtaB